tara:strand:+ start:46071 stop:46397 length:327 start_codon:yes stop_codon:yes gene_type:complete
MNPLTTPTGIEVSNEEQVLEISWEDGRVSKYPLFGLRKNCPCVSCRGGHDKMNTFEPEAFFIENPPLMNISDIKTIGNHAIQITWIDGHNSGMYRWETLRELDPENFE